MRNRKCLAFVIAATVMIAASTFARADSLRMGGSGAAIVTLTHLGAAFAAEGGLPVEVIPSLGSAGGIRAVKDGALDIGVSARPLTPDETATGVTLVAVARTAFALATSHRNPPGLKSTEIADLFKAEAPHWVDGTPMRIILRPRSDTDTALLGSIFPGMRAAIEQARRRLDVPVAGNDQDNADLAGRIPGSLAGVALGQVVTEKRDLRLVAIDGVDPTLANLEQGVYPYARTMGFVFPATRRAAAERFLAFVQSPRGESILRACGYLPARE